MRITFLLVVTIGLLVLTLGAMHDEGSLAGAYEFVRLETPDGTMTDQKGMMVIKDGFMCHLRTSKERENMSQEEPEAERDRKAAAAFRSANGTCGKFTIEGSKVTATWSTSINPNAEGNSSEYVFERDGDQLVIAPAGATEFRFVYKKAEH